jgi:hypothetical protein
MIRKTSVLSLAVAGFIACASFAASAQTATPPERGASTPHIKLRQQREAARINRGTTSGELTQRETTRLDNQQQHIDNLETKAAADGTVTTQERSRIRSAERRANRDIARKTHNQRAASAPQ